MSDKNLGSYIESKKETNDMTSVYLWLRVRTRDGERERLS